jgi:hypothetical protein
MADSLSAQAPKGLSAGTRRRWREQVDALDAAGRASAARLELVGSWAAALDAAAHARAVWEEAGQPETETGSMGQPRRHHLAVAVTQADALAANLGAKIERAGSRRAARHPAIPTGARVVQRDGSYVVLLVEGRLVTRSARTGEWIPTAQERDAADGVALRWVGEGGVPVFADPPPMRVRSGLPAEAEALVWAAAAGVPEQAVLDWMAHPTPRSKFTIREDVDLTVFLPKAP